MIKVNRINDVAVDVVTITLILREHGLHLLLTYWFITLKFMVLTLITCHEMMEVYVPL